MWQAAGFLHGIFLEIEFRRMKRTLIFSWWVWVGEALTRAAWREVWLISLGLAFSASWFQLEK